MMQLKRSRCTTRLSKKLWSGTFIICVSLLSSCAALKQEPQSAQPSGRAPEQRAERDTRVSRVQISPGDVTLPLNASIFFAAIAYNAADLPIGGVTVTWRAYDGDNHEVPIGQDGKFVARIPGTFKIVAEAARHKGQVAVTVPAETASEPQAPSAADSTGTDAALAPFALTGDDTNADGADGAFDPINRRGRNPLYSTAPLRGSIGVRRDALNQAEAAGSGNFMLTVPIVSLPGRAGLDLNLALTYNSHIWDSSGAEMLLDPDHGWPAAGWSLGFGKLIRTPGLVIQSFRLVDADGTRHSLGAAQTGDGIFTGHSTDGTLIDCSVDFRGRSRGITSALIKYPNGTVVDYTAPGDRYDGYDDRDSIYPTRITDANGNYITITYRNNTGPPIQTITDTLGRTVSFHYDTANKLTAITGPGLNGNSHTLLRLNYRKLCFGQCGTNPGLSAIKALFYPGTGTGYWFGDGGSYSEHGIIQKVTEQRAMSFAGASLTEQGTISAGRMTRERCYSYIFPGNVCYATFRDTFFQPAEIPKYWTMTEQWAGMDTPPAVTEYRVTPRQVEITYPDGTRYVQQSTGGLAQHTELRDTNNRLLQKSIISWELGAYKSPRVTRIETTDERNQVLATKFFYGPEHNRVTKHDYGGVMLRMEITEYESAPAYVRRHIFNLPKAIHVFEGDIDHLDPVARTEYTYDGQPLAGAPGVVQHSEAHNPYAPKVWVPEVCTTTCDPREPGGGAPSCETDCVPGHEEPVYDPATDYRGNITQVKRYPNAANRTDPRNPPITETRRYDTTGNLITATGTSCCEQLSFTYTPATQYAYPTAITRGASNPNSPARVTTTASYDFDTGLPLSMTDANGRSLELTYSPASLRLEHLWRKTAGSYDFDTMYSYDDAALTTTELTTDWWQVTPASQRITRFNGLGSVRQQEMRTAAARPGEDGEWSGVETIYDSLGRPWKQSQPYPVPAPDHHVMLFSDRNASLAINAWEGAQHGTVLRLSKDCTPNNPDCTWTYRDGMWLSDKDPSLAINAYGGAQHGTELRLANDCMSNNPDCTWTYRNGMWLSDNDPSLAINAHLGAQHGTVLKLANNCTSSNPDCTWTHTYHNAMLSEIAYDALGRITRIRAPDGSEVQSLYNEPTRPSGASVSPGQTVRTVDAWGRERWTLTDALGRLVGVVEPNPAGSGSVFEPGHVGTRYSYNGFGQVVAVLNGPQVRSFRYDSLGRLTHQSLPEKLGTLNDKGEYGRPVSQWSDVFTYDERGNLKSHTDARGVKSAYDYLNDPLNRLRAIRYDTTGFGDSANPIVPASDVVYDYKLTGDVTRLSKVSTSETAVDYDYNQKGLLGSKTLTWTNRRNHPLVTEYLYDNVDRLADIRYPAQYGIPGAPRKLVHLDYDVASRPKGLSVEGVALASGIAYNAAGQTTTLNVGVPGPNQLTEDYEFDPMLGFLSHQRVLRAGSALLDLSYEYLRPAAPGPQPATPDGRTGQLTKLINNLDDRKNRAYAYDALGRLVKTAHGTVRPFGLNSYWTQEYGYDPYGNRTRVKAFGPPPPFTCDTPPCTPPRGPELPPSKRDGLDAMPLRDHDQPDRDAGVQL